MSPEKLLSNADLESTGNETFLVSGLAGCQSRRDTAACIVQQGGLFDGNATSATAIYDGPGLNAIPPYGTSIDAMLTDTVSINGAVTIPSFSLGIITNSTKFRNVVGLGRSSSMLTALIRAKRLSSRRWSLFTGWAGDSKDTQLDGSLILGGYDSAKIEPKNLLTQVLMDNKLCPSGLMITVVDILVNYSNGESESVMVDTGLSNNNACIGPDYPLIDMAGRIWDNFEKAAGGPAVFVNDTANSSVLARSKGIFAGGMLGVADKVYVLTQKR
jgi:hypothetical protein